MPRARAFQILSGLSDNQVLPRGPDGSASAQLAGETAHEGVIEARVRRGIEEVQPWRPLATRAPGGPEHWTGELTGLPAGGEYTVELRVVAQGGGTLGGCEVRGVVVGDLWLLAGQSNMEGCGNLAGPLEPPTRLVKSFALCDCWEAARDPLHWWPRRIAANGEIARPGCERPPDPTRVKGAGLGVAFGRELARLTGVPVGLIPCAVGASSMDQWNPARKAEGRASPYGALLERVRLAGGQGKLKGVLWYQGESDTVAAPAGAALPADGFATKFKALVAALREDLADPILPLLFVQLGRFVGADQLPGWDRVRETQRTCEGELPYAAMTSAVDLPLDDGIHLSAAGLRRLGKRLAWLAWREAHDWKDLARGPRLAAGLFEDRGRTALRLEYIGVNGGLVSPQRVGGFSVQAANGRPLPILYDAAVEPRRRNAVLLRFTEAPPTGALLWYGQGYDPYCTLCDERDFPAPACGPLAIEEAGVRL